MQLSDKTIEELAVELNQIPLFGDINPRTLLQRLPFFEGVPDDVLDQVGRAAVLRTYREGDDICRQGEYEDSFYLILKGRVEVNIRTQENPHIPLAVLNKGIFFGEYGPLTGGPRTATITSLEHTTLLEIPKDAFLHMHKNAPSVKKKIDKVYLERSLSTHLRRVSLITDLPEEVLDRLKQKIEMLEFDRGDVIINHGDAGDSLYLIRSGFVKVSIGEGDTERVLAYLKDGNYFGEMGLVKGGKRTADVTAVTRVEAVRIWASEFQAILNEYPEIKERVDATIAAREAKTEEIVHDDEKAKAMKFVVDIGIAQAARILTIDLNKCIRCHCCVLACAFTHEGYSRMERRGHRHKNILLPTTCMHCTDPECMLCPHGGIYRDKDGEIHHTVQCINCGACARRCPYGNILVVEPEIDERIYRGVSDRLQEFFVGRKAYAEGKTKPERRVVKCDMCTGRDFIACVYNCPVKACRLVTPEQFLEMSAG